MQTMQAINRRRCKVGMPVFLGLSQSGKLSLAYLAEVFSRLEPGKTYELMCHPGYFDSAEITDTKLIAYHRWDEELALLQSRKLQDLFEKFTISLSHFSS